MMSNIGATWLTIQAARPIRGRIGGRIPRGGGGLPPEPEPPKPDDNQPGPPIMEMVTCWFILAAIGIGLIYWVTRPNREQIEAQRKQVEAREALRKTYVPPAAAVGKKVKSVVQNGSYDLTLIFEDGTSLDVHANKYVLDINKR